MGRMGRTGIPKKISISLPSPSAALVNFIKKSLTDNEFYAFAAEAPLAAMVQSGVNVKSEALTPEDVYSFMDTLAKVKDAVGKNKLKGSLDFKYVFEENRRIVDRSIVMEQSPSKETSEGQCTKWDSSNEASAKNSESCSKTYTQFQKGSKLTMDDILRGPLVNPGDLEKITRTLNSLINNIR